MSAGTVKFSAIGFAADGFKLGIRCICIFCAEAHLVDGTATNCAISVGTRIRQAAHADPLDTLTGVIAV